MNWLQGNSYLLHLPMHVWGQCSCFSRKSGTTFGNKSIKKDSVETFHLSVVQDVTRGSKEQNFETLSAVMSSSLRSSYFSFVCNDLMYIFGDAKLLPPGYVHELWKQETTNCFGSDNIWDCSWDVRSKRQRNKWNKLDLALAERPTNANLAAIKTLRTVSYSSFASKAVIVTKLRNANLK